MKKSRWISSKLLENKSAAHVAAYVGVMSAFCVVTNFVEFRISTDVQFSLTMIVAMLTGMLIGPLLGFGAAFLGDLVGFFLNSKGSIYMPWVGLSVAMFAFLAGVRFNVVPGKNRGALWWKLIVLTISSFLICTVAINSTGFYLYNQGIGFSAAVQEYVAQRFGDKVFFFAYVLYRLFFKLQIFNSIINYGLLFLVVPFLARFKPLKLQIS